MSSGGEDGEGKRKGKRGGEGRKKRKEGEKARYVSAERGRDEARRGRVEGDICSARDQGEIEIETSGGGGDTGGEGNEGIRSCDCTKFAVRTVASFRRDRNMHW